MDNKQTRLEVAQKLINMELNETIARWANDPAGKWYMIRYCAVKDDRFALQPTHGDVFYGIDTYISIVKACQLSCFIDIQENADGIPAPTLHIH